MQNRVCSTVCHPTCTPALEQSKTPPSPSGEVPKIMLLMDKGNHPAEMGHSLGPDYSLECRELQIWAWLAYN